jgi:lactoylglutathione lyase
MAAAAAAAPADLRWHWQQTMLRIKDPKASLAFYTEQLGMTLIAHLQFPQWEFDLYFLTTLPEGTSYDLDPTSQAASDYLWTGDYGGHQNVTLELTHNYGTGTCQSTLFPPVATPVLARHATQPPPITPLTSCTACMSAVSGHAEGLEGRVYHGGNAMECASLGAGGRDGFGHIAFNVDDVYAASDRLEAAGIPFKKKPNDGRMKGLAFAYDPDGYTPLFALMSGSAEQCALRMTNDDTGM